MAQKKKDYARLNCKLDKTVSDKLEKLCEKTGLSKTSATERALQRHSVKMKDQKLLVIDLQPAFKIEPYYSKILDYIAQNKNKYYASMTPFIPSPKGNGFSG